MSLGLAFSGGKDSMACWYLYRHRDPVVIWVNAGKSYPETLRLVDMVAKDAKRFIEVRTDQEAQNVEHGIPSDVVPIQHTTLGMALTDQKPVKVQSYLDCCYANISSPLLEHAKLNGITQLLCGQRNGEHHKASRIDGQIVNGVMIRHPIENWKKTEVVEYLKAKMGHDYPEHFSIEHSSLDCYDCTGFSAHSKDRIVWMRARHPDLHAKYRERAMSLQAIVSKAAKDLTETANA